MVPIAPARVVALTPITSPQPTEVRVCTRCRGTCDATSQFCRFCGAPLAGNEMTTRPPAPPATTTDPIPPALPMSARNGKPTQNLLADAAPPTSPVPSSGTAGLHGHFATVSSTSGEELLPRARLVIIAKDGGEGPSYPVGETLDIGRTDGEITVPDDRYLSPRHARLVRRSGRIYLRDLSSTNGLYLRLRASRAPDAASNGPPSFRPGAAPRPEGAAGPSGRDADLGLPAVPALPVLPASPAPALPALPAQLGGGGERPGDKDMRSVSLAHPLRDQDLLLVGQQVLRFEVVNDADEGLGPASQHGTLVFGSPATPRYARLSQRTVEGVTRDVFYIRKAETVLGRESGDVVFTEDPFLSRRHASIRLEKDPRRFLLTDLGSSNGTFVQVRGEIPLESGDQFRIGQQLFRVDIAQGT
jgi:pSer/pThr/pTyr-binding forkhead associated (FHA) protein